MSSSNYRRNQAAINQFRKELKAMMDDIRDVDKKVMNRAVNEGVAFAKRKTPVGIHPNPVTFTVKRGPKAGEIVSFKTNITVTGGFLRKSWRKLPTKKTTTEVESELVNTAEYASYWNDGHRIVNTKGGPIKGFVKGMHVLEKTQNYVWKRMIALFEQEIKEVQREHDE